MPDFFSREVKLIIYLIVAVGLFVYIYSLNATISSLKTQNAVYDEQTRVLKEDYATLEDSFAAKQEEYSNQLMIISETYQALTKLPTDESIFKKTPVSLNTGNSWDSILRPIDDIIQRD